MSKSDRNAGKHWTPAETGQLQKLANQNTPTRIISLKLGHPVSGVYAKASELGVSPKPVNQRPYGRSK